ncbi:hypothetical protein BDY19DRAFT_115919 [Irpex rosettiformis]|uniref:Uncharacterized protein n=1 Tax=Irpex rosettiformis TaxID=378272 RepID=A0ACB8U6P9_9APHY|nr:hypothetical protein BDY19DRAFT_115919 [Irpex rosettiformis]
MQFFNDMQSRTLINITTLMGFQLDNTLQHVHVCERKPVRVSFYCAPSQVKLLILGGSHPHHLRRVAMYPDVCNV